MSVHHKGSFVGVKQRISSREENDEEDSEVTDLFEGKAGDQEDEGKLFDHLLIQIDARGVFQDEEVIRAMWKKLHRDDPDLVGAFEDFLGRTAGEIKRSRGEFDTLEAALKSKTNEHEEEVKKLYEEMEFQMKREQQRIMTEEKLKEKRLREEMDSVVKEKERQLQEMQARHKEMEEKLAKLNLSEAETKQDNQRLAREKEMLEEMLLKSQENLEESRSYINILQAKQKDEQKARARSVHDMAARHTKRIFHHSHWPTREHAAYSGTKWAALQLSEGIAMERESLVKQLGMLKDVNKRLLDDKDEAEAVEARRDGQICEPEESEALAQDTEKPKKRELIKQGSLLSKYFPGGPPSGSSKAEPEILEVSMDEIEDDGIEMDDITGAQIFSFHEAPSTGSFPKVSAGQNRDTIDGPGRFQTISLGSEAGCAGHRTKAPLIQSHAFDRASQEDRYTSDAESDAVVKKNGDLHFHTSKKAMEWSVHQSREQPMDQDSEVKPHRIFKIVFVGDSGVGKTSFIHRFCNDQFRPNFSATIGIDFQVKPLLVGDSLAVLQLWDTAGQERFRSVARQYFRKADGVIVMYDVTSEQSYTNVRSWMESVKDGVEKGTVITVVGNKMDLAEGDRDRVIKVKDGSKMAVQYDALFYETSAKTGSYVLETMLGMASLLKDKEDKALEAALHLSSEVKKGRCCS
ncbi:ras and EF-hand domain-containing protein homolog isoform X4 [Pomacea canaliculata]|uniref:ras and EF-hand domain-containing protein homolog isoform X4 n=1 Tax=Pomacea canaliculata TaxID=400727 RepID=UPI000D73DBFB|nr:ras and EF-hand domain-containing protein homolog isoform X4 [Pomacea canaliculata]